MGRSAFYLLLLLSTAIILCSLIIGARAGNKPRDSGWLLGRVHQFESLLEEQITSVRKPKPAPTPLGFPLSTASLTNIMMDYYEPYSKFGPKLACRGPPCPKFGHCGSLFPAVEACWNPNLVDPSFVIPEAPINCPKLSDDPSLRFSWSARDERCSHRYDFSPRFPSAMQLFKMKSMYSAYGGYIFNRTHHFVRNGCKRFVESTYTPDTEVLHYDTVFNWDYRQAGNFYHFLIEAIPSLYSAASLLPSIRHVAILAKGDQWVVYDQLGLVLVGVPRANMWNVSTYPSQLIHADTLYQPMIQICGGPNKALWTSLRRNHFLPPAGLPFFNPDWSPRTVTPLTDEQMAFLPADWVVVLGKRPVAKRALVNWADVRDVVYGLFPDERIVIFNGSLSILEARSLFRRARLFVSGHGAALANVIFMPTNSSIFEIRPHGCSNACYNNLAYASSVRYFLTFGNGTCYSELHAFMEQVKPALQRVAEMFRREDFGGNNSSVASQVDDIMD